MKENKKSYYIEKPKTEDGVEFFFMNIKEGTVGVRAHIHNAVEFLYIKSGSFLVNADDNEFVTRENDLVIFRSNTIHSVLVKEKSEESSYYVVKINPKVLLDLCGEALGAGYIMEFVVNREDSICHIPKEQLTDSIVPQIIESMIRELSAPTEYSNLVYKSGAIQLLIYVLKQRKSGSVSLLGRDLTALTVYKVINIINSRFSDNIDAASCAKEVNMSYSHFSRSFKKATGRNFKQYLNDVRIDRARKLLLTTNKSITEIALECGYNNISYFIMTYRTHRGITPGEDRK